MNLWDKIKAWFKDSATILWARIQYVVGFVGVALIAKFSDYDFSQLVSLDARGAFKMLAWATIAGVVTEIARRRTL